MTAPTLHNDPSRFPRLEAAQVACVVGRGEIEAHEAGIEFVREGCEMYHFFVILSGRVQITKSFGVGSTVLRVHGEGEFIGELGVLAGGTAPFTARTLEPCRLVRLDRSQLNQVLASCPELADIVIPALAKRVHDVEALLQQREKLAALGKLSAGLAHELNNPVAAGVRAVSGLRGILDRVRDDALNLGQSCFEPREIVAIRDHLKSSAQSIAMAVARDPLEESDLQEAVGEWMSERGCEHGWELAPLFVAAGFDRTVLERMEQEFTSQSLARVVEFVGTQLMLENMLRDAERSLERVAGLVHAVKNYSRMDEAPVQETDLNQGVEDTLAMLSYRLRGFDVVRLLDRDLPTVCAHASELNQVWTNLIDNALDAMGTSGMLTLKSYGDAENVYVEISDTGPGIPPEFQSKVFDAFFTTKQVGDGTGLGLDIVNRIVTLRHQGDIGFETSGRGTTFRVRLPIVSASVSSEST